jgi:OHCU decarboxylase
MTIGDINGLEPAASEAIFLECCGSSAWASAMAAGRPFHTLDQLRQYANDKWWHLTQEDWLEAFSKHPRIGEKRQLSNWSTEEQRGMTGAEEQTVQKMAQLNEAYLKKFGWIYIVCATGKNGDEMLALLERRIQNDASQELHIASQEQAKIMDLRIRKLLVE